MRVFEETTDLGTVITAAAEGAQSITGYGLMAFYIADDACSSKRTTLKTVNILAGKLTLKKGDPAAAFLSVS